MKRRRKGRPLPPRSATRTPLPARTGHSTVPKRRLPKRAPPPLRAAKPARTAKPPRPPTRQVARIVNDDESSLLDLIDNLLAKGVMLNADLILALANVDLVYVRLSALLCAADRVLPASGLPARVR
jgi:hypothetical protein